MRLYTDVRRQVDADVHMYILICTQLCTDTLIPAETETETGTDTDTDIQMRTQADTLPHAHAPAHGKTRSHAAI